MSREDTIKKIIDLIMKAFDENNYSFIREGFDIACNFNLENFGSEEIYMSEDDDYVMLGDDMFFFPEDAF